MRLLDSEQRDMMAMLTKAGVARDISLTKKNGWIHINYFSQSFSFHRKKVSRLEGGRFSDSLEYFTGSSRNPTRADNWNHVMNQLRLWVENLNIGSSIDNN